MIVFLTNYPEEAELKDGYFQRVLSISRILKGYEQFYLKYSSDTLGLFPWVKKIDRKISEINANPWNPFHVLFLAFFFLRSDTVYLHSIYRLKSPFHRFLFFISRKKIIDMHGSVPEELLEYGYIEKAKKFGKIEKFAIKHSDTIIVVSNTLKNHILSKYGIVDEKFILIPIFSGEDSKNKEKRFSKKLIYCGGLQKWQQVGKMLKYVNEKSGNGEFTFLVPKPQALEQGYRHIYGAKFPGMILSVKPWEVDEWYDRNSFGLIFREDAVMNRVSCPTKLIEYLQNDIVPVVDSENIGDFKELGYRYVSYKDDLPNESEWRSMVMTNRGVLQKLQSLSSEGSRQLRKVLNIH